MKPRALGSPRTARRNDVQADDGGVSCLARKSACAALGIGARMPMSSRYGKYLVAASGCACRKNLKAAREAIKLAVMAAAV